MMSSILRFALGAVLVGTASGRRVTSTVTIHGDDDEGEEGPQLVDVTELAEHAKDINIPGVDGRCCCDMSKGGLSKAKHFAGKASKLGTFGLLSGGSSHKHKKRCVVVEAATECGNVPEEFRTWTKNTRLHEYSSTTRKRCMIAEDEVGDLCEIYGANNVDSQYDFCKSSGWSKGQQGWRHSVNMGRHQPGKVPMEDQCLCPVGSRSVNVAGLGPYDKTNFQLKGPGGDKCNPNTPCDQCTRVYGSSRFPCCQMYDDMTPGKCGDEHSKPDFKNAKCLCSGFTVNKEQIYGKDGGCVPDAPCKNCFYMGNKCY